MEMECYAIYYDDVLILDSHCGLGLNDAAAAMVAIACSVCAKASKDCKCRASKRSKAPSPICNVCTKSFTSCICADLPNAFWQNVSYDYCTKGCANDKEAVPEVYVWERDALSPRDTRWRANRPPHDLECTALCTNPGRGRRFLGQPTGAAPTPTSPPGENVQSKKTVDFGTYSIDEGRCFLYGSTLNMMLFTSHLAPQYVITISLHCDHDIVEM